MSTVRTLKRTSFCSLGLLALNRLRHLGRPLRVPLLDPLCLLHTGGAAVSHLYREIFVQRLYAPEGDLAPGARVLDAGAHIGMASLFFLSRYPGVRVTAVEANPKALPSLTRNLTGWGERAQVRAGALSDRAGKAPFFVTRGVNANVNAGLVDRERSSAEVERIEVDRLDVSDVLSEPLDFAKIDIEGAEYEILEHEGFHPAHVTSMVVEFHDLDRRERQFTDLLGRLTRERGYRLSDVAGEPTTPQQLLAAASPASGHAVLCRLAA